MTSTLMEDRNAGDITPDDVAAWVTDEFCSLQDVLAVAARIETEKQVLADNEHRAHLFPMAHFAHGALLAELEDHLVRMMDEIVASDRILN